MLSPDLLARRQLLCSNTCLYATPSLAPHLLKSQRLQPAVHGKDQRSSTCTGIFSTKSASARIALQLKSFSYKCAYVRELMTSFLRVINKHTVSKVGKGQGRENRQQDMEQKKLKVYKKSLRNPCAPVPALHWSSLGAHSFQMDQDIFCLNKACSSCSQRTSGHC